MMKAKRTTRESRSRANGHPRNLVSRGRRGTFPPQALIKEARCGMYPFTD